MLTRALGIAAAVILVAACASSGGRSRCTPVTGEFLSNGMAYRDCEVTFPAELSFVPRLSPPMRMEANTCVSAWYDFIVDTSGHVVESTAKLIKTNSQPWAQTVKRHIGEVRYSPATKGNMKVQQLVRLKANFASGGARAPAGGVQVGANASGTKANC